MKIELEKLIHNYSLPILCFFLWHKQYSNSMATEIFIDEDKKKCILKYENKYFIDWEGNISQIFNKIRWLEENIVIQYTNPEIFDSLSPFIENIRELNTNSKIDNYETYYTMVLLRDEFKERKRIDSEVKMLESSSKDFKLLNKKQRKRLVNTNGIAVVYDDGEVKSISLAPYIDKEELSFAIIRTVKTKEKYRRKRYALKTVNKLCKTLFNMNIRQIILWVPANNEAAVNLYTKIGFKKGNKIYQSYCDLKKKNIEN